MNLSRVIFLRRGWSQKTVAFLLGAVSLALGLMAEVGLAADGDDKSFERTFHGTINEKWEIQLTLRTTEPISGIYFYERVKKPIQLEAKLGEDQKWIVKEFDDRRMITGQFVGDIFGRVFYGTWMNTDGSQTFPFHLTETNRRWQGEESPYRSTKQLVDQAKNGNPDAQFHLAFLYHYGQGGFIHNIREAVTWYQNAASHGHSRANYMLGSLYLSGHGVRPNVKLAMELFAKSATAGGRLAKTKLEEIEKYKMKPYLEKRETVKDVQYYVDLMETDPVEAEQGLKSFDSPGAKVYLAYMYYEGIMKTPNPAEKVNSLLREVSEQIRKDYGEINETIYGVGHATILEYMREAGDSTVPCDIYVTYPKAAFESFGPRYGGCADSSPGICSEQVLNDAVPAVGLYLTELGKVSGVSKECDIGTIRCSIGKGEINAETVWNVAPQMFVSESYCLGPCEEDATRLGRLRFKARVGLERFFFENFFFTKDNAKKLAHGYLQSREKAQDVWNELYAECPVKEK